MRTLDERPPFKGKYDQQLIRDSRDSRYYVIDSHPMHNQVAGRNNRPQQGGNNRPQQGPNNRPQQGNNNRPQQKPNNAQQQRPGPNGGQQGGRGPR